MVCGSKWNCVFRQDPELIVGKQMAVNGVMWTLAPGLRRPNGLVVVS